MRYGVPSEFEVCNSTTFTFPFKVISPVPIQMTLMSQRNTVAYDEGQPRDLEKAAVLRDAISDLPDVFSLTFFVFVLLIHLNPNMLGVFFKNR